MDFTHFDKSGNAIMVDVSEKKQTKRVAIARGQITMNEECFLSVKNGGIKKGDVLGIARIAGIMAVKKTAEIIPLCHTLLIENATIEFELDDNFTISAACTVKTTGNTGVEMEALTGVSAALLTIYDMCKAIDKSMEISGIHLAHKSGGKSGEYAR